MDTRVLIVCWVADSFVYLAAKMSHPTLLW